MDRIPGGVLQTDLFGPNGPHRPKGGATAPITETGGAPGYARARRAISGFACEHASAHGPALAMRCIAATRHGNPLRGARKPHGKGLDICLRS